LSDDLIFTSESTARRSVQLLGHEVCTRGKKKRWSKRKSLFLAAVTVGNTACWHMIPWSTHGGWTSSRFLRNVSAVYPITRRHMAAGLNLQQIFQSHSCSGAWLKESYLLT